MSRHGLPLALALTVAVAGCHTPWHPAENYSSVSSGLEQPDSLIEFPEAIANYPETTPSSVQYADASSDLRTEETVLTSGELPESQSARRMVRSLLDDANDLLSEATSEPEGFSRDETLLRAQALYRRVLKQDAENAVAHHRLGVIGDLQEDFVTAEDHYRRALAQTPHEPDLLSDIGYSYQLQDRPSVAAKFLQRALDINPGHARAANNLGRLKATDGEYEAAYSLFERAGSKEHADRAIAHFFPDGKPTDAVAAADPLPEVIPEPVIAPESDVASFENDFAPADPQIDLAREQLRQEFEDIEVVQPDQLPLINGRMAVEPAPARTITVAKAETIPEQPAIRVTSGNGRSPWKSVSQAPVYGYNTALTATPSQAATVPPPSVPAPFAVRVPAPARNTMMATHPVDPSSLGSIPQPQENRVWDRPMQVVERTPIPAQPVAPIDEPLSQYPFSGVISEPVVTTSKPDIQTVSHEMFEPLPEEPTTPTEWPGLKQLTPEPKPTISRKPLALPQYAPSASPTPTAPTIKPIPAPPKPTPKVEPAKLPTISPKTAE
ncbi:MAG: tetratricopeptide repeat protein [Planctomycetaceae bacterium]